MVGAEDVRKLFSKQLSRISDEALRSKVVEVWVTACGRGGWKSIEALKKIPATLATDAKGISIIEHTIAVTEGALALGKAQVDAYAKMPYKIDFDRLAAGGLLHDVGKLFEIEEDGAGGFRKSRNGMCTRHPISGAILAAQAGLDDELLNTIACHAKEGEGRSQVLETVLIHQADFATFDPLVMLEKKQLIQ